MRITISHLLMFVILVLGMAVRLQELGASPLSEAEARVALQARALATGGESPEPGANPGYAALTGLLFFLFDDSDFLARLVPALAGVLLVLAPWLMRRRFGTPAALVLAGGLALDPVLVGISRLADGPMLAAGTLAIALSLRIAEMDAPPQPTRRVMMGVFTGLALLSGPAVWLGLLITAMAWGVSRLLGYRSADQAPISYRSPEVIAGGLTLILAATLFLRVPEGLSAFAGSIGAFLEGFTTGAAVPMLWLLIALAGYQGFVILFAALGSWEAWKSDDRLRQTASIFLIAAFSIVVFFPGRAVTDLVWIVLLLWVLAAPGIAAVLERPRTPVHRPALLALVIVILMTSFWVNLAAFSIDSPQAQGIWLRLTVLAGTIVLAGLSALMVGLGWEPASAWKGLGWAIVTLMVFGSLQGIFGSEGLSGQERRELWQPSPVSGETGLLTETIHELGDWTLGNPVALDIAVSADSPSIDWVLRGFQKVTRTAGLSRDELPGIVITDSQSQNFRFASVYRGQGLTWRVRVLWGEMTGREWLRWLVFKEAPSLREEVIVWARADLFLTGDETALDAFPPDAAEAPDPEEIIPLENVEDNSPDG